jgi:hypothetical protein
MATALFWIVTWGECFIETRKDMSGTHPANASLRGALPEDTVASEMARQAADRHLRRFVSTYFRRFIPTGPVPKLTQLESLGYRAE